MAKILGYNRTAAKAVTLDTVNGTIADLGAAFTGGVDVLGTTDGRSRNTVAVFGGDPYALVRMSAGNINVFKYTGSAWASVATFTTTLNAAVLFTLHPISLQVVNDTLVAVFYEIGVTACGMVVRTSTDGAAWAAGVGSGQAPGAWAQFGQTGDTVVWKNTVWASSGEGILGRVISPAAWVGGANVSDTGTDTLLNNQLGQSGSFAFWNNDLYFVLPDTTLPKLYKLPSDYTHTSVAAVAGWVNQSATSIPAPGALAVAPDGGNYCLFTNAQDELCLWTNGANGTKLSKTTAATFPAFADITTSVVPSTISALTAATSIGLYEDDRRRTNELHSFVFRTGAPVGTTYLVTWDGVNQAKLLATKVLSSILFPNDQKSDQRTFTNLQPTCHITAVAQAFPGQATITYTIRDSSSRVCAISPEYSDDGGDTWKVMTEGSGGDGLSALTSSSAGISHTFVWDCFIDLGGTDTHQQMRVVPRISGV